MNNQFKTQYFLICQQHISTGMNGKRKTMQHKSKSIYKRCAEKGKKKGTHLTGISDHIKVSHNKECYAEVAPVEGGASDEEDGMFPDP